MASDPASSAASSELEQKLAVLRENYAKSLGERISALQESAGKITEGATSDDQNNKLGELLAVAHKIAGSAGTFGYPELGDTASALEEKCEEIIGANNGVSPDTLGQIQTLVEKCTELSGV